MKRIILLLLCVNLCICLGAGSITAALAGQADSSTNENLDVVFWESVKDSNDIDMLRAYLKNYPNGAFADLAKIKIKKLETMPQKPAAPQIEQLLLRNTPMRIEEDDIKKMVKKHNFCDWYRNHNADFKNVFIDNNDGTITDKATGLIWQKSGSWSRLNRGKAKKYIKGLNRKRFAGRSNWRLPTVEELASLIENKPSGEYNFYIDPIFNTAKNGNWLDRCWSSDTLRPVFGSVGTGWVVNFQNCGIVSAHWYSRVSIQEAWNQFNYVRAVSSIKQK